MLHRSFAVFIFMFLLVGFWNFSVQNTFAREQIVPLQLSRKAALHYAGEVFGKVIFSNVKTYTDAEDIPQVYVFTFYRKDGQLPSSDLTREKVSRHRNLRKQIEQKMSDPSSPDTLKTNAAIKDSWKKMRQEQDFVTVIAGARYSLAPVIQMYKGLPLHFVAYEDAIEIAQKTLPGNQIALTRYLFIEPLRFEFEFSDETGNTVLISPQDFMVRKPDVLESGREKHEVRSDEEKKMIQQKWQKIKALVE